MTIAKPEPIEPAAAVVARVEQKIERAELPERRHKCACGRAFEQTAYGGAWWPDVCPACAADAERNAPVYGGPPIADARAAKVERLLADLAAPKRYAAAEIEKLLIVGPPDARRHFRQAQRLALGYCAKWPERETNPRFPHVVVMRGGVGTQKTYLAYAIARRLIETALVPVVFTTLAKLVRDVRGAWGRRDGPSEDERLARYTGAGLLVIDEASTHALYGEPRQTLYDVVAPREADFRPTIITSNEPETDDNPALSTLLGAALADRAQGGGLWEFGEYSVRAHLAGATLQEDA